MLSLTVRYAFSAMTALARRAPGVIPVPELAGELDLPTNYLAKTLDRLRAAGLLEGVRGRSGGFRLAAEPEAVSLADIAGVFDALDPQGQCLMGRGACRDVGGCPLHSHWKLAIGPAHDFLREHTLAEAVAAAVSWDDAPETHDTGVER